jgi:hypothetical protein
VVTDIGRKKATSRRWLRAYVASDRAFYPPAQTALKLGRRNEDHLQEEFPPDRGKEFLDPMEVLAKPMAAILAPQTVPDDPGLAERKPIGITNAVVATESLDDVVFVPLSDGGPGFANVDRQVSAKVVGHSPEVDTWLLGCRLVE